MKYTGVPYRTWRGRKTNPAITEPDAKRSAYSRIMRYVGDAINRGAEVNMDHRIINPTLKYGEPYDVIDVTIEEQTA